MCGLDLARDAIDLVADAIDFGGPIMGELTNPRYASLKSWQRATPQTAKEAVAVARALVY
jgi:hypothetical protein